MFKIDPQKTLSILLIWSMVLPSSFFIGIKKIEAGAPIPVFDASTASQLIPFQMSIFQGQIIPILQGVLPGQAQKEGGVLGIGLDGLFYYGVRILVRQLTQSIVDWINSGFQGNPSFVQNPKQFFANAADRTIGEFIYDSGLGFLCKPFEINIRLALGLQYSPFKDKIRCTLSSVLQNVDGSVTQVYQDFMNGDFIAGGGWDTWLQVTTVPQNNQLGALLIAQAELDARIGNEKKQTEQELSWSGGLLSQKECTETKKDTNGNVTSTETYKGDPRYKITTRGSFASSTYIRQDSDGNVTGSTIQNCKIITPGSLISDQLERATGAELDALNVADEINEIVGVLANFLITKVIQKGLAEISSNDLSADDPAWRSGLDALRAQQYQAINSGAANNTSYSPSGSSLFGSGSSGGSNPNYNDGTALGGAKQNVQNVINTMKVPEQNYLYAYQAIDNAASTTISKFTGVIACYQNKINTLNLTSSQISTAQTQISVASTTISNVTFVRTTIAPNIASSQSNLSTVQAVESNLAVATSVADVTSIANNLNSLAQILHTEADAAIAQNVASTTINNLISDLQTGDVMQAQCNVFPN